MSCFLVFGGCFIYLKICKFFDRLKASQTLEFHRKISSFLQRSSPENLSLFQKVVKIQLFLDFHLDERNYCFQLDEKGKNGSRRSCFRMLSDGVHPRRLNQNESNRRAWGPFFSRLLRRSSSRKGLVPCHKSSAGGLRPATFIRRKEGEAALPSFLKGPLTGLPQVLLIGLLVGPLQGLLNGLLTGFL